MNWPLLQNSLLLSATATLLACSLGFVAALFAAGLPARWRSVLFALALVALALPPFLVVNCWLYLLGAAGIWRHWLPLDIFSLPGAAWLLALLTWPITLLAVWSAWQRLEASQLECDMAVTGWALIRGLLLPLSRSALSQAAVLTFVLALNNFSIPSLLQVKVYSSEVWIRFSTQSDALAALKVAWPLLAAPLLLVLWASGREIPWPRLQGTVTPSLLRTQLGQGWFWFCGIITTVAVAIAVGIPLLQLAVTSGTWSELPKALAAGQYTAWNSFFYSFASAALIIGLSLAVAVALTPATGNVFRNSAGALGLNAFLWLPLLVPGVFLGIALIVVLNRPWLSAVYQSAAIVLLAFSLRYVGLGWNPVRHALGGSDPELVDAARLDGATRWQLLRHVFWPQIAPTVAVAWYIIYLLCLWDVESILLIYPPGGETLSVSIFNLLHYGHDVQVNALCVLLLGLAVAPLAVFHGFTWCRTRWQSVGPDGHSSRPRSAAAVAGPLSSQGTNGAVSLIRGCLPIGCSLTRVARQSVASDCSSHASNWEVAGRFASVWGVTLLVLFFSGCSPNAGQGGARLESRVFSSVQVLGSRGAGIGQFIKPRSVAVDLKDNLYVADMTGRIQKFSSNGVFLLSWQMPQTDLGKPKGMSRDLQGNIVVLEPHYQRVNQFSPSGELLAQWGHSGTNPGQFTLPRAIAFNSRNEAFVSEYSIHDRVQRFAADRELCLSSLGHSGSRPGEFNRPEGLFVDTQDRLYVADSCNHRIQVFSPDGRLLHAYGKPGRGEGELSYPYDICVDAQGLQYVCEFGNSRIQVFDRDGAPLEIIGGPGSAPGRFSNPWCLALDSGGNLYVADSQNHRVQKLLRRADHPVFTRLGQAHTFATLPGAP